MVTYTTSGIFNFAHGAIGMVMAFMYWQLRSSWHWPAPLALVVVAVRRRAAVRRRSSSALLMRRLTGRRPATTLVVTLGLLLILLGVAQRSGGPERGAASLPEFFAGHSVRIFGVNVT